MSAGVLGMTLAAGVVYLIKRRRLSHLALQNPRAELVNRYLDDPPTLLMPVHIGTYTAHMGMTIVITAFFLVPPDPRTDVNNDGIINADDLGDFITEYFEGSC